MPRQRGQTNVDLFPFLSVLCCVIGTMMLLMVTVMSTRVVEADEQVTEREKGKGANAQEDAIDDSTYDQLSEELDRLAGILAVRLNERDELLASEQRLTALIEEKKDSIMVPPLGGRDPVELDRPEPVEIVPDASSTVTKDPVYVEVKAEGYLVHREDELYPPVTKSGTMDNPRFSAVAGLTRFLTSIDERRDSEYLLLLVHPNGVEALKNLREYLLQDFGEQKQENRGLFIVSWTADRIGVGVEPFSRDWELIVKQADE